MTRTRRGSAMRWSRRSSATTPPVAGGASWAPAGRAAPANTNAPANTQPFPTSGRLSGNDDAAQPLGAGVLWVAERTGVPRGVAHDAGADQVVLPGADTLLYGLGARGGGDPDLA